MLVPVRALFPAPVEWYDEIEEVWYEVELEDSVHSLILQIEARTGVRDDLMLETATFRIDMNPNESLEYYTDKADGAGMCFTRKLDKSAFNARKIMWTHAATA